MSSHRLEVKIDPDRCVTYGKCAAVASGVFMIDQETEKAFYDPAALESAPAQTIFAAARACPTQAIQIHQFGKRIYPQILSPMAGEIENNPKPIPQRRD